MIYLPALLDPRSVERRAALCAAWFDPRALPLAPRSGAVSLRVGSGADPRAYAAIGFPVFGGRAIRADVVEQVDRLLAAGGEADLATLADLLRCPSREAAGVVAALGVSPLDTAPSDGA